MSETPEITNLIDLDDSNTLIIMDTNVWLDLYGLPPTAITSIVEAFTVHKNKFWLPHQIYTEFNRHIKKSRDEALGRYKKIKMMSCDLLSDVDNKINQEFENLKRNNLFEASTTQNNFTTKMSEVLSLIKQDLDSLDLEHQQAMSCISDDDIIQDFIEDLQARSNTRGFSINQLIKIYEEGEIRYKYKIAPGYTDIKKENLESDGDYLLRKYGDLVIWKEIIQHIKGTKNNVIFVQNEKKSDWWQSPRIHKLAKVLTEEYQDATSSEGTIEMINFEQLLSTYGEILELPATTIKDIVSKLKLEKLVCEYIDNNKNSIIETYIQNAYEGDDRAYNILQDSSLFGGTVETVEDVEIQNVSIISSNFEYDKDWDLNYISAEVELDCNAYISEYVNKYVSHSGNISFKIRFTISVYFSISFADLDAEPQNAFEITEYEIDNEAISELKSGDFSIDVDFDEDLFRDR